MQAIIKLIQAFLWAWQYAKENPRKSIAAGVGVGATSAAMLMSGVQYPPPLITAANTTNAPGSNGQVLESNGDNTYTFGEPGGVGGGATELSELDDVADTLAGAQGDFLGWDGADWDDIEVTFDTLTDVTITTPAAKQTIRYNGSGWVNSQLASTDLSDFAATISGDSNDILAWNGSAFDDTPFVTAVTSAFGNGTDNYVLTSDGAGGVAWEAASGGGVDATGVTDGWVYTADGADGAAFEAPSVGGLLTPDGSTAITRSSEFNVRDYGASGKKRVWHATWATSGGTTTVTTTGNTGVAGTHDFVAGNGIVLLGAGAACAVSTPSVAAGNSVTPEGTTGATTYQYTFVFHDGNGGYAAPTSTIETTTGNATLTGTNRNLIKGRIPYGATSVTIYGNGTSSRKKLVTLDLCSPWRSDAGDAYPTSFVLTALGGGGIRLTLPTTGHGIVNGDYINLKCNTASDTEYDVQALVTNVSGAVVDCSGTTYTDDATGYLRLAQFYYRDCGNAVALHEKKYVPDHENPYARWRAGMAARRGQVICDTTNNQNFRAAYVTADRRTGTVEPTWTTNQTTNFSDGQVLWVRDLDDAPVAEPSVSRNQALLTTVANVPTPSTFTTTTAATADNASHKLALSYNDIFAFRNAVAAAKAYGGGVVRAPAGEYQFWVGKHTDSNIWTSNNAGSVYNWVLLDLGSATQYVGRPSVSLRLDPGATVRARLMQNSTIVEDVNTTNTIVNGYYAIGVGGHDVEISGGTWEWSQFCGGLTEHECTTTSYDQVAGWILDYGVTSAPSIVPYGLLVSDTQIHWPNFGTIGYYTASDGFRHRKSVFRNVSLYYGGGDGDLGVAPIGEFEWTGGEVRNVSRLGSHAFYLFINGRHFKITNALIAETYKNSIQVRGTGGDSWSEESIIANCQFERSGPVLIGDITSENDVTRASLSNLQGAFLQIAECSGVTVTGGIYTTIQLREDNDDIKLTSLTCDTLNMGAASGGFNRDIHVDDVTCKTLIKLANMQDAKVGGVHMLNPWVKSTNLVSGVYKWTAVGGLTDIYSCSLLDGTTPGFATPTANATVVQVRDVPALYTSTSGNVALGALTDDTSYFGNTEVQTIAISGSPTGGSFTVTYNGNTSGSIAAGATAATVQTALRLVTGLSACTVTQSGSGNNLTYTVCMTGVSGDPPQMTSTSSLTGGTPVITHATPNAYPGFNTYAVKVGDDSRRDPDAGQFGSVYLGSVAGATNGVLLDSTLTNIVATDWDVRSTWNAQVPLVSTTAGASTPTMTNVLFDNCLFEMTGLSSTGNFYLIDFNTTALPACDLTFRGGKHFMSAFTDVIRGPIRINLGRGGNVWYRGVDLKYFGDQGSISNAFGQVHLIDCDVQHNEQLADVDAAADTFTRQSGLANLGDGTSHPVLVMIGPTSTALPDTTPDLVAGTIYWWNHTTKKLYASESNADGDTSAYTVETANGPVILRVMDAARLALSSNFEFIGDLNSFNAFGECRGNKWRGSDSATYAAITSNQSNYQLIPLLTKHFLSSDASREIDGFDAPAGGTFIRRALIVNTGAQDIVLKDDTDTDSAAENRIACHTNADITISAGESIWIEYDTIAQRWRTIGYTASWELKSEIMPASRLAQWAIEPKQIQLALAA